MPTALLAALFMGFAAAGITALATWVVARRQIKAQYITAERTKWRNDIRRLTFKACRAILERNQIRVDELRDELRIRLNPFDPDDKKILQDMKVGAGTDDFVTGIAELLKHDWERVKLETGFPLKVCFVEAKRGEADYRLSPSGGAIVAILAALVAVLVFWVASWLAQVQVTP